MVEEGVKVFLVETMLSVEANGGRWDESGGWDVWWVWGGQEWISVIKNSGEDLCNRQLQDI